MKKGLFITFEGTDGCGKSTQMRLFLDELKARGCDVLTTREPGGTLVSERIREIILDTALTMSPVAEAFAYACARAQHVEEVIKPAVNAGKVVVCDRYVDSSYAYQGVARGLGYDFIDRLFKDSAGGYLPDLTFFLDIDPETAFLRKGAKAYGDRMELAGIEFFKRVYEGYLEAARRNPGRIAVIDAKGDKLRTHELVMQEFSSRGLMCP